MEGIERDSRSVEAEIAEAMPSNRRREIGGAWPRLLAEQIIQDDPYMSKQAIMDSGPSSFGGKLREDAFFVRNSFERQFNTLNEVIWMLVYRAISLETNTGPYVIQIPNFEIRNVGGIRTVQRVSEPCPRKASR